MPTEPRHGNWMQTFSGRMFWPLDPRVEELHLEDIAHALACQNRFAGHTRVPYSVAEHSVRVSLLASAIFVASAPAMNGNALAHHQQLVARAGLLHDAAEAYLVDLPRPVKRDPRLAPYRDAEARVQSLIELWADLPRGACHWSAVRQADAALLMTEARDLCAPPPAPWGTPQGEAVRPLADRIEPWGWQEAEAQFLARFRVLAEGCSLDPTARRHFHHCPGCYRAMPCAMDCSIDDNDNGIPFGGHARCDDCGEEPDDA